MNDGVLMTACVFNGNPTRTTCARGRGRSRPEAAGRARHPQGKFCSRPECMLAKGKVSH